MYNFIRKLNYYDSFPLQITKLKHIYKIYFCHE